MLLIYVGLLLELLLFILLVLLKRLLKGMGAGKRNNKFVLYSAEYRIHLENAWVLLTKFLRAKALTSRSWGARRGHRTKY